MRARVPFAIAIPIALCSVVGCGAWVFLASKGADAALRLEDGSGEVVPHVSPVLGRSRDDVGHDRVRVLDRGVSRQECRDDGRVRVLVVDAEGVPMSGVELRLLLPRARGWGDAWLVASRETNAERDVLYGCSEANGIVEWTGLSPKKAYRFGLPAPHVGDLEPKHERVRLDVVGDRITTNEPAPEGLSGEFEVSRGSTVELRCRILRSATVKGQIMAVAATLPPQVKLYRIRSVPASGGRGGVLAFDNERFCVAAGDDGRFRFEALRPGDFLIRAWWMVREHVYFASEAVHLAAGAEVDAGVMPALVGRDLTFVMSIEDEVGRHVHAEEIFADSGRPPEAVLSIAMVPDSKNACHMIQELVTLPIGVRHVLHGFTPGRLHVSARPAEWRELRGDVIELEKSRSVSCRVETARDIELALHVERGVRRVLRVTGPRGEALRPSVLFAKSLADGRVHSVEPRDARGQVELVLPRGGFDLIATMPSTEEYETGLFGTARLSDGDRQVVMHVSRASKIRGVVRDEDAPPAGRVLAWTYPESGWTSRALFHARCDEAGRFDVSGLPPNALLEHETPSLSLRTPAPGATRDLQLRGH